MTSVAGAAVVVGVDGSPRGMVAVEVAAAEAALRHRPLRIVHALAWPKLPVPLPPGLAEVPPASVRDQACGYLAEAAGVAGKVSPDVPVRTELVNGRPATVLTNESRRADLHAWTGSDWTELDRNVAAKHEFWSGDAQERRVLAEALAGTGDRYPDVPVRRQVLRGNAGSLLSEWSRTAQLVVVGDRGHGGLAGLLLGSVSQHLIFHADCPTTVVRARQRW